MEQKINLDKFLGDFREELCNRNMGFLIEVIDAALKQQHIGIYDGIVVEEKEEKPDTNNQAERASTTPENQEEEFLYHTPSASIWPYREEHYMLVDRDCARLLKLLRKILSSLPEHEVLPRLSYFQGIFEGSAMRRQQKIDKQMRTDI